ncbi:hypothetical protein LTR62_007757 [Meristemomyces frigidus]|uniref:Uncharacterized protein n=1 Tax=Meristemomyces frigidus TaxID=1508187 RepID=A0AAN7TIL4_9PEZI|nr:hypothetical protein LTR62_007757 [Meristemomyces frigidus]
MAPRRSPGTASAELELHHCKGQLKTINTTPFRFFDLPRELRDQIYTESLVYKRKYLSQHGARLRGRQVAHPNILLISKQFKTEYLERAEEHTTLVIVDRPEFHGEKITLPREISYARHVELHLAIACDAPDHFVNQCRVTKEVRMHHNWLSHLCSQMRHLKTLRIDLVIDPHQYIAACEQNLLELQYKLSNVPELMALRLLYCDYAGKDFGWDFSKKRTLAWELDGKDRMLHRVAAREVAEEVCEGGKKVGVEHVESV